MSARARRHGRVCQNDHPRVFPSVPVRDDVAGTGSLFSTAAARADLGWRPAHSWRDEVRGATRSA